jgi:hypothetical protein
MVLLLAGKLLFVLRKETLDRISRSERAAQWGVVFRDRGDKRLFWMGYWREGRGDLKAATAFYRLSLAERPDADVFLSWRRYSPGRD